MKSSVSLAHFECPAHFLLQCGWSIQTILIKNIESCMKLNFDTKNLSRKQIVVAATTASLTLGFIGGWFAGRNALRNEFKESISSSLDGLNNLFGESTESEAFEEEAPKTLDENGNEILDSLITT